MLFGGEARCLQGLPRMGRSYQMDGEARCLRDLPKFDKSDEMVGEARCLRGLSRNGQELSVSGCGLHLQLLSQR